jgi:hypothetical protein
MRGRTRCLIESGAGLGPVDIVTPAHAVSGEDRHLQSLAVGVRDGQGNELDGVTCTLSNDQGSWSVRGGETVTIRRSTSELRTTCTKDDQIIASAVIPSAQTRVAVATGPFGGEAMATLPAYPVALDFAPASTAAALDFELERARSAGEDEVSLREVMRKVLSQRMVLGVAGDIGKVFDTLSLPRMTSSAWREEAERCAAPRQDKLLYTGPRSEDRIQPMPDENGTAPSM